MKVHRPIHRLITALLTVLLIAFTGCTDGSQIPAERTSFMFDTIIEIKLWSEKDAEKILDSAFELCRHYDRLFDRHNPDSDISRINSSAGQPCTVDPDTAELLSIALEYSRISGGRFDITCGRVTSLWDFSSDAPTLPDSSLLSAALETVGWQNVVVDGCTVTIPEGTQLDLGGIAKGYIADRVVEHLRQLGVKSAIVNLGGNVKVLGDKNGQPFSVGIQSPTDPEGYAGVLSVCDRSVVTAGSYQRSFELNGSHYHHILDLSDGMPASTGLSSVSIIADSSSQADALATTCFLLGLDEGMALVESMYGIDAVFITDDGQIIMTDGAGSMFRSV